MTPEERNKLIREIKEAHKDEPLEDWYTLVEDVQKQCASTRDNQEL
jgi:hypothetical protein